LKVPHLASVGAQGFKQAVPELETPVVHGNAGLGLGQQVVIEPDELEVRFIHYGWPCI